MKKTLLTLIAAITLCGTAIAQTAADKAAGEYKGDLYISLGEPINDETEALENQSITITKASDNTVNFALYNFSFNDMPLGDILLNNVPIAEDENGIIVFKDNPPVEFSFMDGLIEATAFISQGSCVSGTTAFVNVDVVWTNPGAIGLEYDEVPIYVRFIGDKDNAPSNPYDLNGDGEVNVGDVTTLVNMILGKTEINPAADLNKDGDVNVGDVTTLVNVILGK